MIMNLKALITCCFLLILPVLCLGQIKSKSQISNPRLSPSKLLEAAEEAKEDNPLEAVGIIEDVIAKERRNKKGSNLLGQAYFLLGNIYEEIKQNELAEQRYNEAIKYTYGKANPLIAEIHYRLGIINLQKRNEQNALIHFNACINQSTDDKIKLKCEVGITDIKIMMNDNQAAISDLEMLQKKYDLDSISLARIEARKTQAYVQLKDFDNASVALQNSYNTLPRKSVYKKEEIKVIELANEAFYSEPELSNVEKIKVQNSIDYADVNDDNLVRENFRKSMLYNEDNNDIKADQSLGESKRFITPKTAASLAAEVYKKSYESNLEKGKISLALEDLESYIEAKENELESLKNELNDQVEIVKSQKRIDIAEKDYTIGVKDKYLFDNQIYTQQLIIGFLSLILLASAVFFYFLYKNIKAKKKANQLLYLKSLRTQMNPHFIFNALNSVNNFIAQNDEKAANKFLSDFSQLMRLVLDYSQKDFISIEEEIELNKLYLKLEHFRFRDKFKYTFENHFSNSQKLEVPPMLIQPFIENAVWHGLRYKSDEGDLKISFHETNKYLIVEISDNGIGREKSKALKTKNQKSYNSTGMDNVSKRIQLINEIYRKNYEIEVTDLHPNDEDKGTSVKVKIPFN